MTKVLRQSLTGFRQGDHICVLYEDKEEQVRIAAAFIADGLRRGERSIYAADSAPALQLFRSALDGAGIDVGYEEERRSLILLTKDMAHVTGGRFDASVVLKGLSASVDNALDDGYIGLRVCGDMSWLLDGVPGSSQVVAYEAACTEFFRNVRALGMCQYDRRRLPASELNGALATHPSIFMDGRHTANPYHAPTPGKLTAEPIESFNAKYLQLKERLQVAQ